MLKIFSTGDIISLSKLTKEGEGMNIGERIRNRREELGLTQEELAKNSVINHARLLIRWKRQENYQTRKFANTPRH